MFTCSLPLLAVLATTLVLVAANPVITAPPAIAQASVLPTAAVSTIDVKQCSATLQCCQSTIEVPVLTSLLPILPSGLPLPSLGPVAGLECASANNSDVMGDQCLKGVFPVCCEAVLPGGLVAEGCEPVTAPIPLPTILPPLPTISIPGLPPITISIPLLPPIIIGESSSTPAASNPLGISLPIPLPTISLPFGLVEASAAVPSPSSSD